MFDLHQKNLDNIKLSNIKNMYALILSRIQFAASIFYNLLNE